MHERAATLIAALDLQPHPEGGWYREVYRSALAVQPADDRAPRSALTTIYFLLVAGTQSRWHRVRSDEAWHFAEGSPLELHELHDDMAYRRIVLGPTGSDTSAVHVIPAGHWQAASPLGDYALVCCTVGPGFDFADFTMMCDDAAAAAALRQHLPGLASLL